VPLGQKFFAVLLAIAVGAGVFTWQHRRAAQSTNAAVLSFDPSAAQQIDPGLVQAAQPAVALAQSILTDPVVATLSKPAFLSSSDMNNRVGEFRSRLALSEPSPKTLRVRFIDADPARSAAAANAVASILAAWTPGSAAATAPAPNQNRSATQPGPSLSASLADLEKQLSTTSRELDQPSSNRKTNPRHAHHGYEPASHTQAKQQQLLNTRIRAAENRLDDLRLQFSANSPGAKARLDEIHQALVSIVPAGAPRQSARAQIKTGGTSARQLREEREELTHAIAIVEKQRHALQTEEAANSAPAPGTSAPGASAAPAPSSGVSESNLPAPSSQQPPATSPVDAQSSPHLLTLVEPANAAPHTPLLPAAVAGLLCFLVYLIGAAIRFRPSREEAAYENPGRPTGFRMITPNEPVARAAAQPESPSDAIPWHRASFSYEPPPDEPPPTTDPGPSTDNDDNPRRSSRLAG
jgi:hypothetical protein